MGAKSHKAEAEEPRNGKKAKKETKNPAELKFLCWGAPDSGKSTLTKLLSLELQLQLLINIKGRDFGIPSWNAPKPKSMPEYKVMPEWILTLQVAIAMSRTCRDHMVNVATSFWTFKEDPDANRRYLDGDLEYSLRAFHEELMHYPNPTAYLADARILDYCATGASYYFAQFALQSGRPDYLSIDKSYKVPMPVKDFLAYKQAEMRVESAFTCDDTNYLMIDVGDDNSAIEFKHLSKVLFTLSLMSFLDVAENFPSRISLRHILRSFAESKCTPNFRTVPVTIVFTRFEIFSAFVYFSPTPFSEYFTEAKYPELPFPSHLNARSVFDCCTYLVSLFRHALLSNIKRNCNMQVNCVFTNLLDRRVVVPQIPHLLALPSTDISAPAMIYPKAVTKHWALVWFCIDEMPFPREIQGQVKSNFSILRLSSLIPSYLNKLLHPRPYF